MKNFLLAMTAIILFASCTKSSLSEKDKNIPTINFEGNSNATNNLNQCGICPGHIKVGWPVIIPDGPNYCLTSTRSICGIGGPTYKTNKPQTEGFIGSFQNVNGKLQMTVEKESLTPLNRKEYFENNSFIFDKPLYMNDVVLKELNLTVPYLINAGTYSIVTETTETFTIIF